MVKQCICPDTETVLATPCCAAREDAGRLEASDTFPGGHGPLPFVWAGTRPLMPQVSTQGVRLHVGHSNQLIPILSKPLDLPSRSSPGACLSPCCHPPGLSSCATFPRVVPVDCTSGLSVRSDTCIWTLLSMLCSRPPIRLAWSSLLRSARQLPLSRPRFFSISVSRYSVDMETVDTTERLSRLRQLMQEHQVDVYSMTSYLSYDLTFRKLDTNFPESHPFRR